MYKGELIIASGDNLACTNHAVFSIAQKLVADRSSMSRVCNIEGQKLYFYEGEIKPGDAVQGIIRLEIGEKEEVKYFTGIMLSLNLGLAKIQLDGELQDENVQNFLNKIERYEFSR